MNATIETPLNLSGVSKNSGHLDKFTLEFNRLLMAICMSKDGSMLREFIGGFNKSEFFNIGFGGSHMWVKQINNEQRLLIVYF